jgi:hypothetical protein
MIKLQDILSENLDPNKQYTDLLSKLEGGNKANIEKAWDAAGDDTIKQLKVINRIKDFLKSSINESVYFDPKSNKELDLQWNGRQWEIDIRKKGDMSFSKPVTIKRDTLEQIKDWCRQYNLPTDWITEKEINEVESAFKIDPALAGKIYDILVREGVKLDMTKAYFFSFLNNKL